MDYPSIFRRYLATLLDIAVIWFCVFGLTRIPMVANSSWGMPMSAAAFIALYEPVFTSFAVTLGQALMRFRVRQYGTLKRIPIHMAYLRVIVKYFLGGISVLTIPARSDRRGVHDLTVDSIVVNARDVAGNMASRVAVATASHERSS